MRSIKSFIVQLFITGILIKNLVHRSVPFPPLYSILNSYLNEESIVYLQRYSISHKLQTALDSKKGVTCTVGIEIPCGVANVRGRKHDTLFIDETAHGFKGESIKILWHFSLFDI